MASSLFHPDDPAPLRREINLLINKGYVVRRPSKHQIKIAAFNYFWSTGTITQDPSIRHDRKGFDALLELLDRFGKREIQIFLPGDEKPRNAVPPGQK